ncbi:MAG TPA: Gx transporter family protein [Firmicutes bacterium]|uniref:Gx transporter family protein n=1 Tax=Capillibacterium thermochitinicola TaxID=2699427 RepID=A0A8J6HZ48_9FIRM|nr:Gx transporter family protein [Capillibacterium thermochitinicola]MBA2132328.1 Gx transporter family protein [Capillibacterium thermochitinicola]HHW12612.1 Gx transporter family protein [Bacillota bacterium]
MKNRQTSSREQIKTITKISAYIALGVTLNLLESFLVPLGLVVPIPGARIGLANVVTLVVLVTESQRMLWGVTGGRIVLAALLTGTLFSVPFALSVGGSIAALLVMGLFWRFLPRVFSLNGISVLGAVAHNCGQLFTLYLLVPGTRIFYLLPWALLLALPSGWLTGYLAQRILERQPWAGEGGDNRDRN